MASVSKHIRQLRTARGMTQEELAQKLYVTRQTVSAWETGRSQPDLDALEQIAAALEVEVTEIIYGAPPASPALGPVKRRWAMIGGGAVLLAALLFFVLLRTGIWGTWQHGLPYQFFNSNYAIAYTDIPGAWSVDVNLADLESNAGKVLYEDESGCRILVNSVDEHYGNYRIWFQAHGVYDRSSGQLVSGCQSIPVEKTTHTLSTSAFMTATVDGTAYPCTEAGASGLIYRDGNMFGFHLNPRQEGLRHDISIDHLDHITVTVSGLTRFSTSRNFFWDIY